MGAPVSLIPAAAVVSVVDEFCPDCGKTKTGDFCENCGYNYMTNESGEPDEEAIAEPEAVVVATIPNLPVSGAPSFAFAIPMNIIVQTDCSLNIVRDPDAIPFTEADRIFPIDLAETLVGRRNDTRKIFPDISIPADSGISSRHLKLIQNAEGGLDLLDLDSANGTVLNGATVTAGVTMPLNVGDEILIGAWTRLKVALR
jgi:hypothetical protein